MERKDKIYAYINSKEYVPLKLDELKAVLCVPEQDSEEFDRLIYELTDEGRILLTKKKRYISAVNAGFIRGRLSCNPYGHFGFVHPDEDDEDIFILPNGLGEAYDGDTVLAVIEARNEKRGRPEGHIVKIISRGRDRITGVIKKNDGVFYHISPDSTKIYASVRIPVSSSADVDIGSRVLVEITEYPKSGIIKGVLVKNLGNAEDLKSNIEAIICSHSIKQEFDPETIKEAENAPKRASVKEMSTRLDLRDKLIITIDGDDARDFDDAVSVERINENEFLLGVHIADVTAYVKPGSALDREAFQRGTSVYLADRVIPMLPAELSNGICSLNPKVNRLTLSVFMRVNKSGEITFDKLVKSVIRSHERMTYNNAADLLENPSQPHLKKYKYLIPLLSDMNELAGILHKHRAERGSINFDFPESRVIVDKNGEPIDIIKSERRISHKIIEEFMLAANETIAELAFWAELPFVYRVHEAPSIEKAEDFNRFLLNFGLGLKGKFDKDNPIHPKAFCQVLDKIKGTPEEIMISTYMLRSLMKAEYKCENSGHFGLAAKYYCHFTSPIRRYPDLMIHRILKEFIDARDTMHFSSVVPAAAQNSSDTEIEAEYCERDVDDLMKASFMTRFIGEEFEASVTSVTSFGVFVQLENTVEGLIRLDSMKDDFYEFDETAREVKGQKSNKIYKIGMKLNVVLIQCDLLTRRIEFVRSEDYSANTIKANTVKTQKKEYRAKPKKAKKFSKHKNRRKRKF